MLNYTENYKFVKPDESEFYDINVPNGNMDIIDAELKKLNDGKAPTGHGLGGKSASYSDDSFLGLLKKGCGFYTVGTATDTPYKNGEWLGALQIVRQIQEGAETGLQLACYDFAPANPNIWIRATLKGEPGNWVELIHTGNATSILPFTRIKTGAYYGTGIHNANAPIVISADFKPRLLCINGVLTLPYGVTGLLYRNASNSTGYIHMTWEDSSVSFYFDTNYDSKLNAEGNAYFYALIG